MFKGFYRCKDVNHYFLAILTTPADDNMELNKAIVNCKNLVNTEWKHRQTNNKPIKLNVGKVAIPAGNLFDQGKAGHTR